MLGDKKKFVSIMVVLGGPGLEKVDGKFKIVGDLKERLDYAVKIFKKNEIKDNYVAFIVSGGVSAEGCPADSTLMKNYLMDRHFISESNIIEEPLSFTMVENALCIRDHIMRQYLSDYVSAHKVMHVTTSQYQTPRVHRIFQFAFQPEIMSGLLTLDIHGAPVADENKPEKQKFVRRQELMNKLDEVQRKEMIEMAEWQSLNDERIAKRLGNYFEKETHLKLGF